jgi:hypothetical protein
MNYNLWLIWKFMSHNLFPKYICYDEFRYFGFSLSSMTGKTKIFNYFFGPRVNENLKKIFSKDHTKVWHTGGEKDGFWDTGKLQVKKLRNFWEDFDK